MGVATFASVNDLPDGYWRWRHVDPLKEWACKKTGTLVVDPNFLDLFEELRLQCGFPLPITSGYRSPLYNSEVSDTGMDGPHTCGCACDITVTGPQGWFVLNAAMNLGYQGIGVKAGPPGYVTIHLDECPHSAERTRPALWGYR